MRYLIGPVIVLFALAGCSQPSAPPPSAAAAPPPPPAVAQAPVVAPAPAPEPTEAPEPEQPPEPAVSAYVQPPDAEPAPVQVDWAPPPMLTEPPPPPPPQPDAVWVGGYWVWEGIWVWAYGHWMPPPHPRYHWFNPYYEHRDDHVIFIPGFWGAPGVQFRPPPPGLHIQIALLLPGVVHGPAPMGPPGIFLPPPPGSRRGLIVPSPLNTPPAVMIGAPPVVKEGMHITIINNTVINNSTVNVTNVRIEAPAGAVASGHAFTGTAPAVPHLAAATPPMVRAQAPRPASTRPIASYVPGARPPSLPAARAVRVAGQQAPASTGPAPAAPASEPREQHRPSSQQEAPHTPAEHTLAPHPAQTQHAPSERSAVEHKPELTHAPHAGAEPRKSEPQHPAQTKSVLTHPAQQAHPSPAKTPEAHEKATAKKPAPAKGKAPEKNPKDRKQEEQKPAASQN